MAPRRVTWEIVRFTAPDDGAAYIDLWEIGAITDARGQAGELLLGARVILYSGAAVYVLESADAVFAELHRARTQAEPARETLKVPGAPAPSVRPIADTKEDPIFDSERWMVRYRFNAAAKDTPPIEETYSSMREGSARYETVCQFKGLESAALVSPGGATVLFYG